MTEFSSNKIYAPRTDDGSVDLNTITETNAGNVFALFVNNFKHENQYIYLDQLRSHFKTGLYYLEVELLHLSAFNDNLHNAVIKTPNTFIPLVRSVDENFKHLHSWRRL